MTTTADPSRRTCPNWCVHHDRNDSVHPEDRYTRHTTARLAIIMSRAAFRDESPAELTLRLEDAVYDERNEDEWGPMVYIDGHDGSGSVACLSLTIADAEKVIVELTRFVAVCRIAHEVVCRPSSGGNCADVGQELLAPIELPAGLALVVGNGNRYVAGDEPMDPADSFGREISTAHNPPTFLTDIFALSSSLWSRIERRSLRYGRP